MISSSLAGPSAPTVARLIESELARVRGEIARLAAEEYELTCAQRVIARLAKQSEPEIQIEPDRHQLAAPSDGEPNSTAVLTEPFEITSDCGTLGGSTPSLTGVTATVNVSKSDATLTNVGAIGVEPAAQIEADAEPEREVEPEPDEPEAGAAREVPAKARREGDVPAAEILGEIRAFLARAGMAPSRFAKDCMNDPKFVANLEGRAVVRAASAERIRKFIADWSPPPTEEPKGTAVPSGARKVRPYCTLPDSCQAPSRGPCRVCKHAHAAHVGKVARRDPTIEPETPLMDAADRQRIAGQRHSANVRRGQEQAAAAKLDSGEKPKNGFERSLMANIERRRSDEARQADPVEQAKLALQRKGRVVYSAIVSGGRKDRFIVSGQQKDLTPAELIDLAEKVTGEKFRRAA